MSERRTSTVFSGIRIVPSETYHPYRLRSESNKATCAVLTRQRYRMGPGCFHPGHNRGGRIARSGRDRSQTLPVFLNTPPKFYPRPTHFGRSTEKTPAVAQAPNALDAHPASD